MTRYSLILVFILLFCSCGRRHPGRIINKSDDTIIVSLTFNYPFTEYCPDNYFRERILFDGNIDNNVTVLKSDSILNTALLEVLPNAVIDLGTVRMGGGNRNDYRSWEFSSIDCSGNGGSKIHADSNDIMKYISKPWTPMGTYDFIIE